jgi:hypothetical protein
MELIRWERACPYPSTAAAATQYADAPCVCPCHRLPDLPHRALDGALNLACLGAAECANPEHEIRPCSPVPHLALEAGDDLMNLTLPATAVYAKLFACSNAQSPALPGA